MSKFKFSVGPWNVHTGADSYGPATRTDIPLSSDFYRQLNHALAYIQFENTIIHSGLLHNQIHEKLLSCALFYFNLFSNI